MTPGRVVPVFVFLLAVAMGLHFGRKGSTPAPAAAVPERAPVAAALRPTPLPALVLPERPLLPGDAGQPSAARVHDALCRGEASLVDGVARWLSAPLTAGEVFALSSLLSVPAGGPTCVAGAACDRFRKASLDPQGLAARAVATSCGPGGGLSTGAGPMPEEVPLEVAEAWAYAVRRTAGLPTVPLVVKVEAVAEGASWRREATLVAPAAGHVAVLAWRGAGALDGASLVQEVLALPNDAAAGP